MSWRVCSVTRCRPRIRRPIPPFAKDGRRTDLPPSEYPWKTSLSLRPPSMESFMAVNFAIQSKLDRRGVGVVDASPPLPRGRMVTSAEWVDYFRANAERARSIPWGRGAGITPEEHSAIARSLQAWQLGETSDGRHLRAAAP